MDARVGAVGRRMQRQSVVPRATADDPALEKPASKVEATADASPSYVCIHI